MTAKTDIENTKDANAVSVESTALLGLLADIRAAVGDSAGRLMQDELVEHCRRLTNAARKAESLANFWDEHGGGNGVAARAKEDAMILACRMIDWPNDKITDRHRERTLAANPTSDFPATIDRAAPGGGSGESSGSASSFV